MTTDLLTRLFRRRHVAQRATAGDNAIIVLSQGNNVTINIGGASLTIECRHRLRAAPANERELLLTEFRATDFVGRTAELNQLRQWLEQPRATAIRCLIGRAGAGKTRLALELCDLAERGNWHAGFVAHDEWRRFANTQGFAAWLPNRPTLLVIDNAAAAAAPLRACLEHLARPIEQPRTPIRLLLLERHADHRTGWWSDLLASDYDVRGPDTLADPIEPVTLASLAGSEHRRALFYQAARRAAALRTPPIAVALPAPGQNPAVDARLAEEALQTEPLFLLMAGLAAPEIGVATALTLGRPDLAARAATRESQRLAALADTWGVPRGFALHLAACATLQNGCDAPAAHRLIAEESISSGWRTTLPDDVIETRLAEALHAASPACRIDAVRPDLVGEAFLLREVLRDRSPQQQIATIERAWRRAPQPVATSLIRSCVDFGHTQDGKVLGQWLEHLAGCDTDATALSNALTSVAQRTVSLRDFALTVQARRVAALKASLDAQAGTSVSMDVAGQQINLANRLAECQRYAEALIHAKEAVDAFRSWHREGFVQPNFVAALVTLSNAYGDMGQSKLALNTNAEAVSFYRQLIASDPGQYEPTLAAALNNLSGRQAELGHFDHAVDTIDEAVFLRRKLAESGDLTARIDLAGSLRNLSLRLTDLDQHVQHPIDVSMIRRRNALDAAREAVLIALNLAPIRPDMVTDLLAASLKTLEARVTESGNPRDATGLFRTALEHLLPTFQAHPAPMAPPMAVITNGYRRLCEQAQIDPATDLLKGISEIFAAISTLPRPPDPVP